MKYPRISIVTPNFNNGAYLEDAILSVISQDYPNLEYIVIDGGSNDNSIEIIRKYERRISYWISEQDNGMYNAIQKGFSRSTGEIMAWINSDDKYHPDSLFTIAEIFNSFDEVNWLQGIPSWFDENGRCVMVDNLRKWSKFDFYTGNYQWIQQESVFWRRELWIKAGSSLNTKLKFAGDFDLWLKFFRYEKLYVTNSLIAGFRVRTDGQLSSAYLEEYQNEVKLLLAEEPIKPNDSKIIKIYKALKLLLKFLSVFKIFDVRKVESFFKERKFGYTPVIRFNREKQKFGK